MDCLLLIMFRTDAIYLVVYIVRKLVLLLHVQTIIWATSQENLSEGGFRPGKTQNGLLSYRS